MTRAVLLLALCGCSDPYLHVSVEGADLTLTATPDTVDVGVYADRHRVDFSYVAQLSPRVALGVPTTDFVILTGDMTGEAQLRVAIPSSTTTWFADAMIGGTGSLEMPLFASESAVTNANLIAGDTDTSALFGPGIVMTWVDAGGVEARIERDPDLLISRANIVTVDHAATNLRLTSRPNPLGYGPDLYALAWIGGDHEARLRVSTLDGDAAIQDLGTTPDELAIGAAFQGATFAAAVVQRTGNVMTLRLVDETGANLGGDTTIETGATALLGVVVTRAGIAVGWRGNTGSHIGLISTDGVDVLSDTLPVGDLAALAASSDGSRILSLEDRAQTMFQVSYFTNMVPAGVETSLGATALGSRAALSTCIAVWPEVRDDGSNAIDLRFATLDANGAIIGDTHLLNVEEAGDHITPTSVCASSTRAYATFFDRAAIGDTVARLRIRRIPTYGGSS